MRMRFALVLGVSRLPSPASPSAPTIRSRRASDIMKTNGAAAKIAVRHDQGNDALRRGDGRRGDEDARRTTWPTFPTLFPEGSDQGDTNASPDDLEEHGRLQGARGASSATDAKAADSRRRKGLDAFKTAFNAVGDDCGACHEKYRLKRQ